MKKQRNRSAAFTVLLAVGVMGTEAGAQEFELTRQQFDSWITGRHESPITQLSRMLEMRIDAVDRITKLSSAQREKLALAGWGDAIRFEDAYDEMRAQLVDKKYDRRKVGEIHQKVQQLSKRYKQGLLGKESLFEKVMRTTLDGEQLAAYDGDRARRRAYRYKAQMRLHVAVIEKNVPMTEMQRQALLDWLLAETKPPRTSGLQDRLYVMYQMSKMPQENLEEIFDESQLRVLKKMLQRGASYEQHLRQNGLLPDEEADKSS